MIHRLLPLTLLLACLAAPPPARAEDIAEAKARFRKGAELYRAKQYRGAIDEFEAAYRLKPAGAIHYNVAQCRERLGEWPAAIRSYHDYLRESPAANDRAVVRAAVKKLEDRLAATGAQPLLVYSDPPGAEVRIDGRVRGTAPFHLVLPPGSYGLELTLAGHERVAQEIAMSARAAHVVDVQLRRAQPAASTERPLIPSVAPPEAARSRGTTSTSTSTSTSTAAKPDLSLRPGAAAGDARSATSEVPSSPPRPKEKRRVYTWIAAGTAVAAAAAGGYFGWSARQAESELDDMSQPDGTAASGHASDATSRARRANVMYVVAGSAAAAGVTLFFVEKKF